MCTGEGTHLQRIRIPLIQSSTSKAAPTTTISLQSSIPEQDARSELKRHGESERTNLKPCFVEQRGRLQPLLDRVIGWSNIGSERCVVEKSSVQVVLEGQKD
jgi:hypothetical protein